MKTHIAIIYAECQNDHTIDGCYNSIASIFKLYEDYSVEKFKVEDKKAFIEKIKHIGKDHNNCERIFIDIECHGNEQGLSITKDVSNDFLSWKELYILCKEININVRGQLCLILSSCLSSGYCTYLKCNSLNDACNYLLSSSNLVIGRGAAESLETFFQFIDQGYDIDTAYKNTVRGKGNEYSINSMAMKCPYELFYFQTENLSQQ